ncbi:MAG TPA: hypothetical protein VLC93_14430, partial [Myxococcota bacterium]|nr:hypothetical protein [Myxococcota bacterium]
FIARIREVGALNHGSDMPWDNFKQMSDEDLKSIFVYLRSLPPTKHQTGPRYRKRGWTPEES